MIELWAAGNNYTAMLEDRDYMRQPDFNAGGRFHAPRWSWTLILLAFYAAAFLAEMVLENSAGGKMFSYQYLALSREGLAHGYVWQLLTYQFMHAGWVHLLFNCWAIYSFGNELEQLLGGRKFLALVFASGMVGGVFQVLVALLWPAFGGAVVGASASAFGLVAAFCLIFPERELTLLIFFVIPLQVRAKTLLIGSAVLAVTGIVFHETIMPNVAHAAHLGGMAMGWFFVRKILQGGWSRLGGPLRLSGRDRPPVISRPSAPPAEKPVAEFVANEVDPILDKISAHGIQSLSARERAVLEAARKKMERR